MNLTDISWLRLSNQQLSRQDFKSPSEIVRWMGAIQAQDYNMSRWAIGIRLQDSTIDLVNKAFDEGEIIRTHVLRPTWHIVPSEDIVWMLKLTAPKIKSSLNSRHANLRLDYATLDKTNNIITSVLKGNRHLTRDDMTNHLKQSGIELDSNRASHILFWAELSGIICSGKHSGLKPTYSLIEEWAPYPGPFSREVSLGKLATRYFTSHGPATIKDFSWWSGLPLSEARLSIEVATDTLQKFNVEEMDYWCGNNTLNIQQTDETYLIPAFDEFLISYTDRSSALTNINHKKTISINGIFRPIIVTGGQVSGLWKSLKNKDKIIIEVAFFKRSTKTEKESVRNAVEAYAKFMGKKTEVIFT